MIKRVTEPWLPISLLRLFRSVSRNVGSLPIGQSKSDPKIRQVSQDFFANIGRTNNVPEAPPALIIREREEDAMERERSDSSC